MSTSVTPIVDPGKNPPTVTLDVPKKDVSQIRDLKPGDRVKIILDCEVSAVSEKEPDTGYPVGFAGSLTVEINRQTITKNNDFSALVDEDD